MTMKRISDFLPEVKDYYSITTDGEIFSDNSGKMKTRNKSGTDYQLITLSLLNGKKKTFSVHRLVMMAFNPICNMEKLQVNHKDGNKANNVLNNLEWCTASENQKHTFRIGLQQARRGERSNFAKLFKSDIDSIFELRKKGLTQKEIAVKVKCTPSNISCILNSKTWQ